MDQLRFNNRHKGNVVTPITAINADTWRKNTIKTCVSERIPEFKYHIYAPSYGAEGLPVLIAVHGISHRAKEQARAFSIYAERYGFVVIAPLFDRKNFPAYQRLGVSRRDIPCYSDFALQGLLDEIAEHTGAITDRVYLFGYSGGGQFVHRYAMAYPEKVYAVALGAAGWYTFPDPHVPFPRGLHQRRNLRNIEFSPEKFLKVPMGIFVGENDKLSDPALKRSPRLDLQQGTNRIERAERWTKAMRNAAEAYGFNTRYESHIMKLCGHSFTECIQQGNLAFKAIDFLFETIRDQRMSRQGMLSIGKRPENYRVA